MDYEILRNGSGYVDPTAYKAIKKYQEGEEMEYKRGDIVWYETYGGKFKQALIVSGDYRRNNMYQSIICLTEEPKTEDSVPIVCGGMMYVDCGMVSFAPLDRINDYIRTASAEEMAQVDAILAKNLGIEQKKLELPDGKVAKTQADTVAIVETKLNYAKANEELMQAKAEAGIYKDLYEKLLAKMIG
jgi:hypothetical protein